MRSVIAPLACLLLLACSSTESSSDPVGASGSAGAGASAGAAGKGGTTGGGGGGAGTGGTAGGAGTGGTAGGAGASGAAGAAGAATITLGGARPVKLLVPSKYDGGTALPLMIMLHGYGYPGAAVELGFFKLKAEAEAQGVFYAYPDGTVDQKGKVFWNGTDGCCDFFGSNVDDDSYIMGLIAEASTKVKVDPKRIFLVGHSNGGFMTYRLACNHADTIAAVTVVSGEMWLDTSKCKPSAPVSVLHVQGTADETIAYKGGTAGLGAFPGAEQSVADWVTFDQCNPAADTSSPALDLDTTLAGTETKVSKWGGCASKSSVELWTMEGALHAPSFSKAFAPAMVGWLMAHPKP